MEGKQEKNRFSWVWYFPVFVFVVLSVLFYTRLGEDPNYLPTAMQGKPLPEFSRPLLGSETMMDTAGLLQAVSGEPFILNVWASWCPSCYDEHPYLMALNEAGIKIIGLNYKDETDKANQFIGEMGNPYSMILVDADGGLGLDLGVYGAPETFLVSREGLILYRYAGPLTEQVWQAEFVTRMNAPAGGAQ